MSLKKNRHNGSIYNGIPNWDNNIYDYNNRDGNKDIYRFN